MASLKTITIFDKGLDKRNFLDLVPGRLYNVSEVNASKIYNGPRADEDEDFHVLDAAFKEYATLVTIDYRMLAKATLYHRHVVGHKGDRCLRGCVVIPDKLYRQRQLLQSFKKQSLKVFQIRKDGSRIDGTISWKDAWENNLGVNLRSDPSEVTFLCECRYKEV